MESYSGNFDNVTGMEHFYLENGY